MANSDERTPLLPVTSSPAPSNDCSINAADDSADSDPDAPVFPNHRLTSNGTPLVPRRVRGSAPSSSGRSRGGAKRSGGARQRRAHFRDEGEDTPDVSVLEGVGEVAALGGEGDEGEVFTDAPHDARLINAEYESLDYDNCENELYLQEAASFTHCQIQYKKVQRWIVMFLIAVCTGLVACFIDYIISYFSNVKFSLIRRYYDACTTQPGDCMMQPLGIWLAWNILCVGVAAVITAYGEPVATGSGISQVKCFLNGVKIPHVVRIKTLVVKVVGVCLCVLGGLAVGKEGPMIHSGAVIAAGISQGRSTSFGFDLHVFEYFRTDTEKRDFVSGGAAAGVAAAFGAPVGGVLFALEEGASFWDQALTWRIFFASVVSAFTLNLMKGFEDKTPGNMTSSGLVNFGKFGDMNYTFYEMGAYIIMAFAGGFFGAAFNFINIQLTIYRRSYLRASWKKVIEAILIAMTTTLTGYVMILCIPDCHPRGTDDNENQIQMYCPDGSVSSMAILWFQSPEQSVKSLFHDPFGAYEPLTLGIFALFYFFLACWTYGASVPSGLFIPGLVVGAAWGRLISIFILTFVPGSGGWVDPGKFALIGAAAQLGGIVRMTLSLTVILTEATGNISLGLPIMMVLMIAKWTGDFLTEGIYDMHIELQGIPILGWAPPGMSSNIMAREVMSYPVTTFHGVERVSTIVQTLSNETHDGFPVVHELRDRAPRDPSPGGATAGCGEGAGGRRESVGSSRGAWGGSDNASGSSCVTFGLLTGTITRSQLIVLLRHKNFVDVNSVLPGLSLSDFRAIYPRFPKIQDVDIAPGDMDRHVDLRPYMNPAPYSVFDNTSLPRIFKLFRGLGLRHLVVVNRRNEVIGIVTRKDLARYHLTRDKGKHVLRELQMTTG